MSDGQSPRVVLFVCTGNVFRSVAAEYAVKMRIDTQAGVIAASAGIAAVPQPVHPLIQDYLRGKGVDVSAHTPRRLTGELITASHLTVAMGLDHQEAIRREFGIEVPLFNELCAGCLEPVLDLHEALPDWRERPEEARRYVYGVIDHIWEVMPNLITALRRANGTSRLE